MSAGSEDLVIKAAFICGNSKVDYGEASHKIPTRSSGTVRLEAS